MAPSPMLSMLAKAAPTLKGRKVGCLVTDGCDGKLLAALRKAAQGAGAKLELIAPTVGGVTTAAGDHAPADHKIDGGPSVLFDAVAILASVAAGPALAGEAAAVNFLRDAYGHLKVIGHTPGAGALMAKAGLSDGETGTDSGMIALTPATVPAWLEAAAKGRVWTREPLVRPPL